MGEQQGEVNFFGIKIHVKNPKLAAVLNSSVTDDVATVAERVRTAEDARRATASTAGSAPSAALAAGKAAGRTVVPLDPADRVSELPPDWVDLRLSESVEWGEEAEDDPLAVLSPEASDDPLRDLRAS